MILPRRAELEEWVQFQNNFTQPECSGDVARWATEDRGRELVVKLLENDDLIFSYHFGVRICGRDLVLAFRDPIGSLGVIAYCLGAWVSPGQGDVEFLEEYLKNIQLDFGG